jgi:O-antigen ligase
MKRIAPLIILVIGGMIGLLAVIGGSNPLVFLAITLVIISLIVIIKRPVLGLYAWIVFLPVQLAFTRPLIGVRLAISDIFIGCTLIALLLFILIYRKALVRTSLNIYMLALVLIFLLCTLITYYSLGYVPRETWLNKDLGLLILIFSFFAFVFLVRKDGKRFHTCIRLLLISGSIANVFALSVYFFNFLPGISIPSFGGRFEAFLVDPNAYGGYLTVIFLIQLSVLIARQKMFSPSLMKINSLLLLFGIVLTESRSAWVGLVLGLVALLWFYRARFGRTVKVLLPLIIIITGIFVFLYTQTGLRILSSFDRTNTIEIRWQLIETGLDLWKHNPVFGIGIEAFSELSPLYLDKSFIIHNTYVWLLVETGIVGLAVFTLLLLRVAKNFGTAIKHLPEERGITIGICCAFVSMLGFMIGIEAAYQRHLWLLFAFSEILYMMAVARKLEATQVRTISSSI